MSSLEALWGFFAGSKGLIVRSAAGRPQYLAPNPAPGCPFIPLLLHLIAHGPGARQDGADARRGQGHPAGNRGKRLQPLAELPAGNKVHPKCPLGVLLQPAVPCGHLSEGRGRTGIAPGTPGPYPAGFPPWVGISQWSMGWDCSCPCGSRVPSPQCSPAHGSCQCNFFPMHGTCGTVLLLRDLLLSKPWDGLKSVGSLIWPFIAVCEEVRMGRSD